MENMIRVLTEETINKIAAGEVIENPASVVKELVENAMDAGAGSISIEIKGGGFQLIKITDNGSGMSSDDALLCFERHATSKIADIEDLFSLTSMGFRGEALASIASIARVDLITALQDGSGTHVEVEGGKIRSVSPASRNQGTTFEVRSLFYNVPARKKFQKQASAATAEIHKLVVTLALAHPEIGFELTSNEQVVLKVAPASGVTFSEKLSNRISDLFQKSFLATKQKASGAERDYALEGILGTPADHRVNRTGQYLFVNRRPIFSPQVSRAIKEGYGQRLSEDRYPVFVIHLIVPPALLDVNVHPQKKEVRFQEGEFIRQFVKTYVHQAFGESAPLAQPVASYSFPESKTTWDEPLSFREEQRESLGQAPVLTSLEIVIGLFEHYLLLDGSTVEGFEPGIVWIDLQQVQQELIYQTLNEPQQEALAQGLLLPLGMELSSFEAQELHVRKAELSRCGFAVECSGKQSLLIEAIPPFLDETDAVEAIRLILQSEDSFPKLSEKIARFAVRRKKSFMLHEALTLWRKCKQLNSFEAVTWTGINAIENLFK
jgi:DNA mismatch repair protein MutL